jgi:hypothetical protein
VVTGNSNAFSRTISKLGWFLLSIISCNISGISIKVLFFYEIDVMLLVPPLVVLSGDDAFCTGTSVVYFTG